MSLEETIHTGDASRDQEQLERWQAEVRAQGLEPEVEPLPGGGFQCRAVEPPASASDLPTFDVGDDDWDDPTVIHDGLSAVPLGGHVGSDAPEAATRDSEEGGFSHQAVTPKVQDAVSPDLWALAGSEHGAPNFGDSSDSVPLDTAPSDLADYRDVHSAALPTQGRRLLHLQKVYAWWVTVILVALVAGWLSLETDAAGVVSFFRQSPAAIAPALIGLAAAVLGAAAVSHLRGTNVIALMLVGIVSGWIIAAATAAILGEGSTVTTLAMRDASLLTLLISLGLATYSYAVPTRFSLAGAAGSMAAAALLGITLMATVLGSDGLSFLTAAVFGGFAFAILSVTTLLILKEPQLGNSVQGTLAIPVELNRRVGLSRRS